MSYHLSNRASDVSAQLITCTVFPLQRRNQEPRAKVIDVLQFTDHSFWFDDAAPEFCFQQHTTLICLRRRPDFETANRILHKAVTSEAEPTVTLSQTSSLFSSPISRINLVGENKEKCLHLPHYHH